MTAFGGERARDREADPFAGAGHHGALSRKAEIRQVLRGSSVLIEGCINASRFRRRPQWSAR